MKKDIFKVGDSVYCLIYGWGIVSAIDKCGDFPVDVDFKDESNVGYTTDGRYFANAKRTLSFTKYTLQGFSQKRPIELPEVGELCLFRDSDNYSWIVKKFLRYVPNDEFTYITEDEVPYAQMKRIKILD